LIGAANGSFSAPNSAKRRSATGSNGSNLGYPERQLWLLANLNGSYTVDRSKLREAAHDPLQPVAPPQIAEPGMQQFGLQLPASSRYNARRE
jgi:hypothetical protein